MRVPSSTPAGILVSDHALAENSSLALALYARIGDDAARALASRAGAGDAEEALLVADLATSRTGAAGGGGFAAGGARAAAVFASLVTANVDLGFGAEIGVLEVEG